MTTKPEEMISITYDKKVQRYTVTYPSGDSDSGHSLEMIMRLAAQEFANLSNQKRAPTGGIRVQFDPTNLTGKELPTLLQFL